MKFKFWSLFCATLLIFSTGCSSKKKKHDAFAEKPEAAAVMPKNVAKGTPSNQLSPKTPEQTKPPEAAVKVHHTLWSYRGLTGPEMWGDLKPEFQTCKSGKLQSPIDLKWAKPKKHGTITFQYNESPYQLMDNGHTVKAIFAPGNFVTINGDKYELVQMHFHSKSEHTISGKQYPLEAHFVHKDAKGNLAVIAVLFVEGHSNPFLESMWNQFPKEKNRAVASTVSFNPANLIPKITTHYKYDGSLTTPPCSEGVSWNVFNTPMEVSKEQLDHFRVLYAHNFRPSQALNGRKVVNY